MVQERARARADVGDRVPRAAAPRRAPTGSSSGSSTGLFAQLVVVPLFREHRVLIQVAGHGMPVVKGLPPLVVGEDDLVAFADALDAIDREGAAVPRSMAGFALTAAGIR